AGPPRIGPWVVRGRIDAIFRPPGAGAPGTAAPEEATAVELVDWKTGRELAQAAGGLDRLGMYALALGELGQLPGDHCTASYCYLGGEEPVIETRSLGPADLDRQRALVGAGPGSLARGDLPR